MENVPTNQRVLVVESMGISHVSDLPNLSALAVRNHPNPFNPMTIISFNLPYTAEVSLQVVDVRGRVVRNLLRGDVHNAGPHQVIWRGRDDAGHQVATGVYFYRCVAGDDVANGRMLLLK
ncbi:hypothetical protein DRQ50_09125 [bacterium]|nr:MAG: hypothetical protein DRQ50_09125 [bacterium]